VIWTCVTLKSNKLTLKRLGCSTNILGYYDRMWKMWATGPACRLHFCRYMKFGIRPHRRRTWTVQPYSSGGANVHPVYRKPKMVAMAISLRTSKLAMSSSDSLTRKPTPRIKQRVASYHTTAVIAHRKAKGGVAMATSVGSRVSAVSAFCRRPLKPPS